MINNRLKGIVLAIVSGAAFGLIPLFTIPLIAEGLSFESILCYRFALTAAVIGGALAAARVSLRITLPEVWRVSILSLMYVAHGVILFDSYNYLSSGIATSLVYTSPVWCAIIGLVFLREKPSFRKIAAIVIASVGVGLLTGAFAGGAHFSAYGLFLGLVSGGFYGVYLTILPRLKLPSLNAFSLTFYIFALASVYAALDATLFRGGLQAIPSARAAVNLTLLALIPTALSNVCLALALRCVDSTIVAILGAFEPLAAMVVGVFAFAEHVGLDTASGVLLILVAVAILTLHAKKRV